MELQMTERAVQRIVSDLEKEGILAREKVGRCNQYLIAKSRLLGHPLENHHTIAEFLEFADS
jgi:DNA-binding Lrp family transcriptional regulator